MCDLSTENMDKLSIPFGIIIGPCTILLNSAKAIMDVAKIVFYGLSNIHYTPSLDYTHFKNADLTWENNVSSKHKPQVYDNGAIKMPLKFIDDNIAAVLGNPTYLNWVNARQSLSPQDEKELHLEEAKQNFFRHLTFIGIGAIRSIPIIGGVSRWYYNAKK